MKSMPLVDMTLTDIPYDVVNRDSNGLRNLNKTDADNLTFDLQIFIDEVVRVTKGSIYVFCSTEQVSFIRSCLAKQGLTTRLCIFEKTNPSPMNGQYIWLSGVECCIYGKKKGAAFNEHCKNTVWRYPVSRNKIHPTQKPLELFRYLIRVSSNEGDIVFDPCLGSGTTALAAVLEKRKYIAFDLNEEYCKIAIERLRPAETKL
jgi:DNA modification methylase